MTKDEIAIVKESWSRVLPIAELAMAEFYRRLFEADDKLQRLFLETDMSAQQSHLASAIDVVVNNLDHPETLAQTLQDLGARHADYDVAARDFHKVGVALLATLSNGLSEHWTQAHGKAWSAAWDIIVTQVMVGFHARRAA